MQLYSWNAFPCIVRKLIADVENKEPDADPPGDGDWAYGPSRTLAIAAEDAELCASNADN